MTASACKKGHIQENSAMVENALTVEVQSTIITYRDVMTILKLRWNNAKEIKSI